MQPEVQRYNAEIFRGKDKTSSPIIGLKASQDLNLIKIVMNVNNAKKDGYLSENVSDQFPKVFEGLGCLKKPYHIKVNPEIVPVVSLLRRQPV